jgi:hypothetical protein
MINFKWSVIDMIEESGAFTQVKYRVTASEGLSSVTTEGNWAFKDKTHQVTPQAIEKDIIDWIKKESIIDGSCIIESNLEKQLSSLNQQNIIKKPWIKPTFTVKI